MFNVVLFACNQNLAKSNKVFSEPPTPQQRRKDMGDRDYDKQLARKGFLGWCIRHEVLVRVAVSAVTAAVVSLICR